MDSQIRDKEFRKVQIESNIPSFPQESTIISTIIDFIKQNIEKGSLNECLFNICIISLGIGLLELPSKVQYLTFVLTPIFISIYGVINHWTFTVLSDAAEKYNVNKYEDLITAMFNPCFSKLFLCVNCFGLFTSILYYQIMLYKFFGGIYNEIFSYGFYNMDIFSKGSFWSEIDTRLIVCFSTTMFILVPLCSIKTSSQMRFITAFGVFSIFLVIFILIIQCPSYYNYNINERRMTFNYLDFRPGFGPDLKFITSISTIISAFGCHNGIFPAISSLSNPTKERVDTVLKRVSIINTVSYLIIIFFGYLSQPQNTPELILEKEKVDYTDFLMTCSLILFSLSIIAKIGAFFNCLRSLVLSTLKFDLDNYSTSTNFFMIFFVFSFSTYITSCFPYISGYLSVINMFYGIFIACVIPGFIYIKSNDIAAYKKYLAFAFVLVVCVIGFSNFALNRNIYY